MAFFRNLGEVITATVEKDPAARSRAEVVFLYPGFHALLFYFVGRWFWEHRLKFIGRWFTYVGRIMTGIEIHPAAKIGSGLFIDHGSGVVIGETAEVGDNVTLYHGVTLGGTSLEGGKRHPTLKDNVIVGAGAKILGPVTVGNNARIGANAVVVKDVPDDTTMVGVLARPTTQKGSKSSHRFVAYGVPAEDLPDPVARSLEGLLEHIHTLSLRVEELEAREGDVNVVEEEDSDPRHPDPTG
ncbi:MAG: serine O-acetyltransferase [Alphaproteobacteria bacterium]|nr:serine O-acetyltransferase [Alphaproteobacteria bacterium]